MTILNILLIYVGKSVNRKKCFTKGYMMENFTAFFIVKIILSYVQFLCWVNESITFYRWNIQLQNIKKFPHLKIIKSTFVQKEKISFAQIFIKEDVIIRYNNKENVYF